MHNRLCVYTLVYRRKREKIDYVIENRYTQKNSYTNTFIYYIYIFIIYSNLFQYRLRSCVRAREMHNMHSVAYYAYLPIFNCPDIY